MRISLEQNEQSLPFRGKAEVIAKDRLAPRIVRLRLRLCDGASLSFRPGQFLRLHLGGFAPRDYSLANQPGEGFLEFHIRDQGEGGASSFACNQLCLGDELDVEGPFGSCRLREERKGPILGIAGGTGLAPIKAIIEEALARGWREDISLYFGVRQDEEFYLLEDLRQLSERHPNFRFIPVAEKNSSLEPGCRHGRVTDALEEDLEAGRLTLQGEAYIAGPPPMVEAAVATLRRRRMSEERIHADAFTLGPADNDGR